MIDTFFNTEADRDLWLRLNSERQIEWEKNLTYFDKVTGTYKPTMQALNVRSMEIAMEISRTQLDYDIKNGILRFTLEDLLTKSRDELEEQRNEQVREILKNL